MSLHANLILAANTVQDNLGAVSDAAPVQDAAAALAQNAEAAASAAKAAGFSLHPTFGQVVEFQFTGLLVVFTVLGGLTVMCYLLAWLLKTVAPDQYHCRPKNKSAGAPVPNSAAAAAKPAAVAAVVPAQAPAGIHPGLSDEEFLAILAVAATEVLGQAVTIVKFRPMDSMDWTWSVQGRVGLHTSHTP